MKKNYFLLFIVFIFFSAKSFSQDVEKKVVETRFIRPSITYLFYEPDGSNEKKVLEKLKTLKLDEKFDDHRIEFQDLKQNSLAKFPPRPNSDAPLNVMKEYNKQVKIVDSLRKVQIKNYVESSTNPIISKWFNRDVSGYMNIDLLLQRGNFNLTDADVITAKASAVNRGSELGEKLISKSYIIMWDITGIKTMEQIYDEMDARARKSKDFKPVKREDEGYQVSYSVDVYKVDFNDSVTAVFYQDYWVDKNNVDPTKISKWKTFKTPIKHVRSVSGSAKSTQPKDPNHAKYKYSKKLTMEELLLLTPYSMKSSAFWTLTKKIEDFRVKAPIFTTEPLAAKIGTKEGLYNEQRFFAYEIGLNKKGDQKKIRKGVVRALKIANNDTVSTGNTQPTIFRQQGGRSLYEGMLLESKEDLGINGMIGYSMIGNKSIRGVSLGIEYLVSQKFEEVNSLYFGVNLAFNSFTDINPGDVYLSYKGSEIMILTEEEKWSGSVLQLYANVTKEIYLMKKGNLYLAPSIGFGMNGYSFSSYDGHPLSEYGRTGYFYDDFNEDNNPYSFMAWMLPLELGIGANLHPNVSFLINPGIVYLSSYTASLKEGEKSKSYKLVQKSSEANINSEWGFQNLSNSSLNAKLEMKLKIRF
jgi:hypothetical protein